MDTRAAFDQGTEAFNNHDREALGALTADDCQCIMPGGLRGRGRDECVAMNFGWVDAFPDARVEIHDVHIAGDVAVAEATFHGTHTGVLQTPMGAVPATGRSVSGDYIETFRFNDRGQLTYQYLMFDRLDLLEQLGLAPAGAAAGATTA